MKVYIVTQTEFVDFSLTQQTKVFATPEGAKAWFDEIVSKERLISTDWAEDETNDEECYRSFPSEDSGEVGEFVIMIVEREVL